MLSKVRNRINPEIPTGSMADIAFLLIVFFMLSTVIAITKGIKFPAPKGGEEKEGQTPSIYLYINETGTLFIDNKEASLAQIGPYLESRLSANPNKPVIVHSSLEATYQKMMDVLDEIKQLEVKLYGATTEGEQTIRKRIKVYIPTSEEAKDYYHP